MYKNKGPVKFEKMVITIVPEDSARRRGDDERQFRHHPQHAVAIPRSGQQGADAAGAAGETDAPAQLLRLQDQPAAGRRSARARGDEHRHQARRHRQEHGAGPRRPRLHLRRSGGARLRRRHDARQGGRRAGEEAARRGRMEDGPRRLPLQGRREARAEGLLHRGLVRSARVRGDPGLHAPDRRRLEHHRLRLDDCAGEDGRTRLRTLDRDVLLPLGRRSSELLFRFIEHPGAEPDVLERSADRRMAEGRPLGADREGPREVLRPRAEAHQRKSSLDSGDERRPAHGDQQAPEGRAAAHDPPERHVQGAGLFVLARLTPARCRRRIVVRVRLRRRGPAQPDQRAGQRDNRTGAGGEQQQRKFEPQPLGIRRRSTAAGAGAPCGLGVCRIFHEDCRRRHLARDLADQNDEHGGLHDKRQKEDPAPFAPGLVGRRAQRMSSIVPVQSDGLRRPLAQISPGPARRVQRSALTAPAGASPWMIAATCRTVSSA